MTTAVHIHPAGHPVLVQISDFYQTPEGLNTSAYSEQIHLPGGPDILLYSTTTRTISVVDLDEDDPRVIAIRRAVEKRPPEVAPFKAEGTTKHF
jgi:hypothetical protein